MKRRREEERGMSKEERKKGKVERRGHDPT